MLLLGFAKLFSSAGGMEHVDDAFGDCSSEACLLCRGTMCHT